MFVYIPNKMYLVAWLRPLAYRHKKLCAHGKGPSDARSKNKKSISGDRATNRKVGP